MDTFHAFLIEIKSNIHIYERLIGDVACMTNKRFFAHTL